MRNLFVCAIFAGMVCFTENSAMGDAEEDYEKRAEQQLKEAIASGKKGDAKGVARHTEEAREQLIEQNREHPYFHPMVSIYGENPMAEHDEAAFEEMAKAISAAEKGNAREAGEAAQRAYFHLKEKVHSR